MFQKMPYKSNIYINYLTQRAQWAIPTIIVLDWLNGACKPVRHFIIKLE